MSSYIYPFVELWSSTKSFLLIEMFFGRLGLFRNVSSKNLVFYLKY